MATKEVSTRKKISQFFWRSWAIQDSWNYERQMNMGFMYGIAPTLDRCYPNADTDPKQMERKKEAYRRHMAFYNCTPQTSAFVLGLSASMEEELAEDPNAFDPDTVNAVKTSLMGPLSGIGDAIFLTTIRVIAAAVGISLCQAGNAAGPIVFLLIYNIPAFWLRVWGVQKGYSMGVSFLEKASENGLMTKVMAAIGIVGAMVIGGMTKDMFWATIPVQIGETVKGQDPTTIQSVLDGIMPGVVGMCAFWIYYWLLSKKINPMWLILGTMVLGVVGAFFGFLG